MNDGHTLTASVPFKRLRASAAACCIFAAATLAGFAALPAYGQAGIPNGVVTAPSLDASQKTLVEEFTRPLKLQLKDSAKLKSARQSLLDPLNVQGVSPSFRLELWRQLSDTVKEMIKSDDVAQVVNGLRIAGEVATDSSAVLVLDHLKSPKASIRYAASFAVMRAFEQTQGKGPAMDRNTALQLITRVTATMKAETDASCFDSMVRALSAAGADSQRIEKVQADGLKALASTTAELLHDSGNKAIDEAVLESLVRAGTTIRDSFTKQQSAPAWLDEGAQFSGDALAYVYRQLRKPNSEIAAVKKDDAEDVIEAKKSARKTITQLVAVAESTATLARQLRGNPNQQSSMADLVRRADTNADATVLTDLDALLKDKLVHEFNLPANRFLN